MFWKKPERTASLALRLSVWYAASAFLLLALATGCLYWFLVVGTDAEDDQYLREKVSSLGTLLGRDDFRTLRWEVQEETHARPAVALLSRVLTADGTLLMESGGMTEELPARLFPAPGKPFEARGASGRMFRLRSERLPRYVVQGAIEATHEGHLLAEYRRALFMVLGLALVAAVLIGHRIARRGIRPVEEIGATVRHIGSATLDQRLETVGLAAELAALAGTFNEMLDRLEDAFGRLARFSSDIAHELRTPINNVRGEVEVALARARTPEEYREVLSSALEETQRLGRLIDSLLFLARAENPGMEISREVFDAAAELAAVSEFYEAAATDGKVTLELEAAGPTSVALDRTLFQRAVGNLVENALAHTPAGGRITLKTARRDGALVVTVTDTGCGIPPGHLDRIFDRFHRVDPARSKHSGGTGLGLAIVKSIAALHGGTAGIASEPGRGTRVTLTLPITKS